MLKIRVADQIVNQLLKIKNEIWSRNSQYSRHSSLKYSINILSPSKYRGMRNLRDDASPLYLSHASLFLVTIVD